MAPRVLDQLPIASWKSIGLLLKSLGDLKNFRDSHATVAVDSPEITAVQSSQWTSKPRVQDQETNKVIVSLKLVFIWHLRTQLKQLGNPSSATVLGMEAETSPRSPVDVTILTHLHPRPVPSFQHGMHGHLWATCSLLLFPYSLILKLTTQNLML